MTSAVERADVPESATVRRRRIVAVGIGNFMEWYDFAIYGFFAAIIGAQFFPGGGPTVSLLAALAVYGVAFLFRPVGGLAFGLLADRRGRRYSLALAIICMGVSTTLIALVPDYSVIGVAAPVLLVVLRSVQGFSAGGEYTGASAFLVESAPADRRARAAAVVPITSGLAVVAGALVSLLVQATVPLELIPAWGWRLPFLLALPLAIAGLYLRLKLEDTVVFQQLKEESRIESSPLRALGRRGLKSLGLSFALASVTVLGYYYLATYVPTFLTTVGGLDRTTALILVAIGMVIYAALVAVGGVISDTIGRRKSSLIGSIGLVIVAIPAFMLMATGTPALVILGIVLIGAFEALHNVNTVTTMVELFPAGSRATGSAVGYNLGSALIAGPGPLIAAALAGAALGVSAPALYLVAVAIVATTIVAAFLPETKGISIAAEAGAPEGASAIPSVSDQPATN